MRTSLDMVTEKVIERVTERVTEAEQKLFSLLLEDPDCTYAVLAEKLGVSYKTIFRELNLLKTKVSSNELDLIQKVIGKSRIGSKGGKRKSSWEVFSFVKRPLSKPPIFSVSPLSYNSYK